MFKKYDTYRHIQVDSFHIHFVNEENKWLVPIWIQVARLDTCLFLLANPLALKDRIETSMSLFYSIILSTRKRDKNFYIQSLLISNSEKSQLFMFLNFSSFEKIMENLGKGLLIIHIKVISSFLQGFKNSTCDFVKIFQIFLIKRNCV